MASTNVGEAPMPANERQAEAWNGPESAHFVAHADRYDRQLEPFTQALLERAGRGTNQVVLDVGCGSGATTLAAAASAERVVGVDLSQPTTRSALAAAASVVAPDPQPTSSTTWFVPRPARSRRAWVKGSSWRSYRSAWATKCADSGPFHASACRSFAGIGASPTFVLAISCHRAISAAISVDLA